MFTKLDVEIESSAECHRFRKSKSIILTFTKLKTKKESTVD
jgi:hypothetical protein